MANIFSSPTSAPEEESLWHRVFRTVSECHTPANYQWENNSSLSGEKIDHLSPSFIFLHRTIPFVCCERTPHVCVCVLSSRMPHAHNDRPIQNKNKTNQEMRTCFLSFIGMSPSYIPSANVREAHAFIRTYIKYRYEYINDRRTKGACANNTLPLATFTPPYGRHMRACAQAVQMCVKVGALTPAAVAAVNSGRHLNAMQTTIATTVCVAIVFWLFNAHSEWTWAMASVQSDGTIIKCKCLHSQRLVCGLFYSISLLYYYVYVKTHWLGCTLWIIYRLALVLNTQQRNDWFSLSSIYGSSYTNMIFPVEN